jgi:hypothetical protein
MYPLHMPKTERPARKTPEASPQQSSSPWSASDTRGAASRTKRDRSNGSRSERRRLHVALLTPAWPVVFMWTSVFYLVADIA